uniref:Peptidase A1 domain-containing protein n=1 Tax=Canis lupus familiaris TaxID=9615 RepID=A0A8C0TQA3_CANLF
MGRGMGRRGAQRCRLGRPDVCIVTATCWVDRASPGGGEGAASPLHWGGGAQAARQQQTPPPHPHPHPGGNGGRQGKRGPGRQPGPLPPRPRFLGEVPEAVALSPPAQPPAAGEWGCGAGPSRARRGQGPEAQPDSRAPESGGDRPAGAGAAPGDARGRPPARRSPLRAPSPPTPAAAGAPLARGAPALAAPLSVPETFPLVSDEPRHIRWPRPRGAFRGESGPEFPGEGARPESRRGCAGRARGAPGDPARRGDLGRGGGARALRGSRRPPEGAAATKLLKLAARAGAAPAPAPPPAPPGPPPAALLPAAAARPVRAQPCPQPRAAPPSRHRHRRRRRRTGRAPPGRARPPGPAAGMGAQAGALLLLPLLAQWLLRAAPAPAPAPLTLPLRVAAPTPGPGTPAAPRADGLALALEPAGGAANFLAMVDNLQGDSGRGYYLEMLIGTPPQRLQILVDTGSSNFAVAGAPHSYTDSYFDADRSSTYRSKGFDVTVKYTQGSWTGFVGEDFVTIPKGFNSSFLVNIATIFESENFFLPGIKWNGILGLAYAALAKIPEFSDGFWTGSQLACWTNSETPWSYFPKISIYLRDENSSQSFRITILPQLYIQPMMGAGLNYECYRFGISPSTNALVIGATVMEGFYVVFDRARKRVGFAASPCAEIAGAPVSEISGPFSTDDIASNCVPALPLNEPILWIVSYTLMSVCGIILLILIVLLLLPFRCRHLPRDPEVVNDESSLVRHRWK